MLTWGAGWSDLVRTTLRMPPRSWVGWSTCCDGPRDARRSLSCIANGSSKRSRWMLKSPVIKIGASQEAQDQVKAIQCEGNVIRFRTILKVNLRYTLTDIQPTIYGSEADVEDMPASWATCLEMDPLSASWSHPRPTTLISEKSTLASNQVADRLQDCGDYV